MIQLTDYGYSHFFESQFATLCPPEGGLIPARITEIHRESCKVITQYGELDAKLKGTLQYELQSTYNVPAVGDFALVRPNENGPALLVRLLGRKSKFSRTDFSGHAVEYVKTVLEQVVASNFDYVFILTSLNKNFNLKRIERYLAASWQSGGIPVVILTKSDLAEDFSGQLRETERIASGACVFAVSAKTGYGLDRLAAFLKPGKTIVFLGSSGVGKSSLVNALAGEELMEVQAIREDDARGRHTTTHRQLIRLPSGVLVIETTGMRELGMWEVGEGLGETFSEIETLFEHCRFADCTHTREPGCAVRAALESGSLSQDRWDNYLSLRREARFSNDKSGYLREKDRFFKQVSVNSRKNKRQY